MPANPTSTSDLFTPLELGALTLPNRIVLAPLTRNRAGAGNAPQAMNATYYGQRASAGLIITEASQISPQGVGYPATPGIHSEAQVAGWRLVTQAVHERDGRLFIQLWHVGRISHPSLQADNALPVAPSAIRAQGEAMTYEGLKPFETPRALESDEIPAIIADYENAARRARDAGFDGVEIHAANGYLLDQFLRDGTNQRSDEYGGDIKQRMRLLDEVVGAVSAVWGAERVGVRLSPENSFNDIHDSQPQESFNAVADMLGGHRLCYLHVVEGDMVTGERRVDYRDKHSPLRDMPMLRVAASLLLMVFAFGAGWLGHSLQEQGPQQLALETSEADMRHVILHISDSDEARFNNVLAKAEAILQHYQEPGVQVEKWSPMPADWT